VERAPSPVPGGVAVGGAPTDEFGIGQAVVATPGGELLAIPVSVAGGGVGFGKLKVVD